MSNQSPSEPPNQSQGPKGNNGQGPATGGGVNWRVLVLMSIAIGILWYAWSANGSGNTKQLSYKEFLNYVDSGKIITDQDLPKKGEKLPDVTHQLKKGGESPTMPTITGFYYVNDPWVADKENSEQRAFRIPVNTQLDDDQLKSIRSRYHVPQAVVQELPASGDGELLTLDDLARMLARGEVVLNDPENGFEMVSREGSNDKYIVGKRYLFAPAPPVKDAKDLARFEILINSFEQSNAYEKDRINDLAEFVPDSGMMMVLIQMLPILLVVVIIFFLFRHQMKSAGRGAMSFGKSKARLLTMDGNKVTFKDVAGIQEAKEELVEVVDYLRDPKKFQKLGGNLPKGLLMVGPPGTGKTLLARAIAGEADVPFFSISGSDFVEMFVGVGASRVRDMFEQGKKNSPCLIFIDEIDAVGRHRGHGMGGGHDEREQTLNALLVEMDGFDTRTGVIIIAATNRPDVLDPALLRPGRFDRQVTVGLPDVNGREEILKVHAKRIKMAAGTDLAVIARGTPGFSGAELANLLNEAALLAARKDLKAVGLPEMEEARDKVRWGRERRSLALSEKEKENTAYHEAGHAILNVLLEHTDPLHKVTIIPRGPSLGSTMFLPEEDKFTYRIKELHDQLCVAMGGRVAEEITFGNVTNGAVGDIRMATNIARKMVCEWGMSENLGMVEYGEERGEVFVARDVGSTRGYSEETARAIDGEIKKLIDDAYALAKDLLIKHNDALVDLSNALLEYETLDADQVREIMEHGKMSNPPSPPKSPIPGNQSDAGVTKQAPASEPKGDEPPLAGEVVGEPA
ncbi:ATP-dependent zinc metalloprotease FtsH [Verrucomicrobiaceae bacterium N1E253]|uniref:ATP-dependent zinc metalloprotease FtsH n=1 Tax=Oceaniferula marina TaxID=2748318 RepID=A0A851GPV7_9BACT|nr:ATP-dependent zinc metalloprotease FtsH [Oceaniferula marina]NWK56860.1 ATP-dependent zinc metalloprotease FtsH [Oceaniferula marina]